MTLVPGTGLARTFARPIAQSIVDLESSGPPPFAPTDIAGLRLWLDASDTASITHAANAVSQWNDKSGLSNHATSIGSRRPTTNTRTVNSLNVIDFDGSPESMVLPSGLFTLPAGPSSIFVVFQTDTPATANQNLISGVQGPVFAGTGRYRILLTPTALNGSCSPTAQAVVRSVTSDTSPHVAFFVRNGTSQSVCRDGGTLATSTNAGDTTIENFGLAAFGGASSSPLNGVLAEVIIYNAALSTANQNLVGNYLASKWGVTWTNI